MDKAGTGSSAVVEFKS